MEFSKILKALNNKILILNNWSSSAPLIIVVNLIIGSLRNLFSKVRLSKKGVLVTLAVFTIIIAGGLSLFACGFPDGLEWSYAERPDQPEFTAMVSNEDPTIVKVDDFHAKYSPLPDYSIRTGEIGKITEGEVIAAAGWTSFAGVVGAGLTMLFVWLTARILRRKEIVKE